VLAEDGRKMSKRLKNYPDPALVLDTYGADALRLYMINSPVVRADDLRFSEDGVKQCLRDVLLPWWNAYSFLVTYARVDGWDPAKAAAASPSPHLLDRWVLSALERLNADVMTAMDAYDLQKAVRPFVHFLDDLTKWYIRRSRRRFWKSQNDTDKEFAYATLYRVLLRLGQIAAPFTPFIAEEIYRNLRQPGQPESVHLCDFPQASATGRDLDLEAQMDEVIQVVELGRQVRTQYDLKVRQPLRSLRVVSRDPARLDRIRVLKELVADELNVREVLFGHQESDLAELKAKADFKKLGSRLGSAMKSVAEQVRRWSSDQVEAVLEGGSMSVEASGKTITLTADDILVERTPKPGLSVASAGALVVALDTELDADLIREGLAREFVNKVQNLRKTADLNVAQRITLQYHAGAEIRDAIEAHRNYIESETLSLRCDSSEEATQGETVDLNGHPCRIHMIPQPLGGND